MKTYNCRFRGEPKWDCVEAWESGGAAERFAFANQDEFEEDDSKVVQVEDEDGYMFTYEVSIDRSVRFDSYLIEDPPEEDPGIQAHMATPFAGNH
jgi:hypothetical protein